jgi:hypothetical protein
MMKKLHQTFIAISLFFAATSSVQAKSNPLFTLENLERERAVFLNNLTTTSLNAYQREQQGNHIIKRLIDMERMVLRDDRIAMSNSIMAKNAFQHYELTFLVHAGSESKKAPMAHWLHSLNITNESIDKSRSGAR